MLVEAVTHRVAKGSLKVMYLSLRKQPVTLRRPSPSTLCWKITLGRFMRSLMFGRARLRERKYTWKPIHYTHLPEEACTHPNTVTPLSGRSMMASPLSALTDSDPMNGKQLFLLMQEWIQLDNYWYKHIWRKSSYIVLCIFTHMHRHSLQRVIVIHLHFMTKSIWTPLQISGFACFSHTCCWQVYIIKHTAIQSP
jgi:hypothetical protein